MNLAIIKFGRIAREFVKSLPREYNIVSVADPETSNLVACEFCCPNSDKSFDYSLSINRKDVDTVVITIQDGADGIALTALAYGKSIMTNATLHYNLFLLADRLGLKILEMV